MWSGTGRALESGKGSVHAGDVLSPIEIRLNPCAILERQSEDKPRCHNLALDKSVEVLRHGRFQSRLGLGAR